MENQVSLATDLGKIEAEAVGVGAQLETLLADFTLQSTDIRELLAVVGATQNATSQLLTELDTLKGRQAVSAAVQAFLGGLFIVYLLTIISWKLVKRCQKVREEKAREEFELLERKLQSSKARRRAKEKSAKEAPVPSQK